MKTKFKILALASILITIFFSGCDVVEEPYFKDDVVIWNGRKIIVYDFTGHKCGNCPRAHETVESLIGKYNEAIIPIAIHCSYFARVTTTDTALPFHYDFRTDIGDFLGGRDTEFGFYGELALPIGLVNNLGASSLSAHTSWGTTIASIISTYPEYLVGIESSFAETDSLISADISVTTNIKNGRKLGLIVFVIEDHIFEWQTDYSLSPDKIEDYEHNHVLRGGFNGNFGEIVKNNTEASDIGDIIQKSYTLKAKPDWNISNCSVVAFVYDDETKEILQAEISHLSE